MSAPTKELQAVNALIGSDPYRALGQIDRLLTQTSDPLSRAWHMTAKAEALDVVSQAQKARSVAGDVLKRFPKTSDPIHVEALFRVATNSFRAEEAADLIPRLVTAGRMQPKNSEGKICALIALAELERISNRPDLAVKHMSLAYSMSANSGRQSPRSIAAEKLARIMGWGGDVAQAVSLIDEVAQGDRLAGRHYGLANDLYMRGLFKIQQKRFQDAMDDFATSRRLGSANPDPSGNAYLDLQICRTSIELNRMADAAKLCMKALQFFRAAEDDAQYQAQFQLARIAFARGDAETAAKLLNKVIASDGASSSTVQIGRAYRLRAAVRSRLGDARGSYEDLDRYVALSDEANENDRAKQLVVQRARFATDREIAKSRQLERDLRFSQERERDRTKREMIFLLGSLAVLTLLSAIVVMGITHRRRLVHIANSDPLTDMLNRRAISTIAANLIAEHGRNELPMQVVLVDLDHFKSINDRFGHDVGDAVLVGFAKLATRNLRPGDFVARWGGEEFIFLFPRTNLTDALAMMERLHVLMPHENLVPSDDGQITFSAGQCSFAPNIDFEAMVSLADMALYEAKRAGRNRIVVSRADHATHDDSPVSPPQCAPKLVPSFPGEALH